MRAVQLTPDRKALLIIASAVLVANALYVLGVFDADPLGPVSRLLSSETNGVLNGVPVLDKDIGYTSQALGHLAAQDWLHLKVPWWNPYEATGLPLAAEMQSAAFFPPTLLLAIGGGQLWEHMLLELIAGCSTYLLLRRIGVSRWASMLAGIAFALNGTFAWFGHAPVNPVPFLPLMLLGLEYAYSAARAGRPGGWWLVATAGALSIYGGFPETTYIDTLFVLAWFAWRVRCAGAPLWRPFVRKATTGGIVAGLLAAPLLVAFLRFLPDAYQAIHATGIDPQAHLPAQSLSQLVLPYVFGNPFQYTTAGPLAENIWAGTGGFLTITVVLLALLGVFSRGLRGLRVLLAVWLVVGLARTYGVPLLTPLFDLIPGMRQTTFSRYAWPTLEFAAIVLAALGLDQITTFRVTRRQIVATVAAGVAIVAVAALAALPTVSTLRGGFPHRSWAFALAWGLAATAGLAAALAVPTWRRRMLLASGVVVLDAVAMFALAELSAPRSVGVDLAAVSYLRSHLGLSRFATVGPFRPDYGAYFRVASINEIDLPIPANFARFVTTKLDRYARPNEFVGTGYRSDTAPTPTHELVSRIADYRGAGVAYVLTFSKYALPAMRGVEQVARTPSARIYKVSAAAPYFSTRTARCSITPNDRQSVQVDCPTPAAIVRRETYLRSWSARLDGHSTPITANSIFQSVRVPAGKHTITFSYSPPGIVWGYAAFGVGVVWLVAGWRLGRRRSARGRGGSSTGDTQRHPLPALEAEPSSASYPSRS